MFPARHYPAAHFAPAYWPRGAGYVAYSLLEAIEVVARADDELMDLLESTARRPKWWSQLAGDVPAPYVVADLAAEEPTFRDLEGGWSRTMAVNFVVVAEDSPTAEAVAARIHELFAWDHDADPPPPRLVWRRGRVYDVDESVDTTDRPPNLGPEAERFIVRVVGLRFGTCNL